MLYAQSIDRSRLKDILIGEEWTYDCPGYISYDELCFIIKNNYIIKKGILLNGKMPMDAENYYVQAGSLNDLDTLDGVFA